MKKRERLSECECEFKAETKGGLVLFTLLMDVD